MNAKGAKGPDEAVKTLIDAMIQLHICKHNIKPSEAIDLLVNNSDNLENVAEYLSLHAAYLERKVYELQEYLSPSEGEIVNPKKP